MENLHQMLLTAGILAVVLMQFIALIKITQLQNNQKHRQGGHNSAGDKKHGNNPNKKHDNRQNQNSNRPQNQAASNKGQQQQGGEKKYEKISSNAQSLKETNTQLAGRSRSQQGKSKVYSERPAGNAAANTNANNGQQKQERPANTPIKQQELPKAEAIAAPEQSLKPAIEKTAEIKAEKIAEVVAEVKAETPSVQYGRR